MGYLEECKEENQAVRERYELALERIARAALGELSVEACYRDYFVRLSEFVLLLDRAAGLCMGEKLETADVREQRIAACTEAELKALMEELYEDRRGASYETSYGNPAFAAERFGIELGQLLSYLYAEIHSGIMYAFRSCYFNLTIRMELFLEILSIFEEKEEEDTVKKNVKSAIYYYACDYREDLSRQEVRRILDPEVYAREKSIVMETDLTDTRYLYFYGLPVTENEQRTARYLNGQPEENIRAMARTYTEGFRMAFVNGRLDLTKKKVVNIRYYIGFERVVREAVKQFAALGLTPTFYPSATSLNPQYEYDHRYDKALFLNKTYMDRFLEGARQEFEERKELAGVYAGPAVIEVFGEKPFLPVSKEEAPKLSEKQQKLDIDLQREYQLLARGYMKADEYSFTIIAYPVSEIGADYEAVFDETIRVNTLDMELYKKVQQTMIEALNQGAYVTVKGRGVNRTSLKVALQTLLNPEKETLNEPLDAFEK